MSDRPGEGDDADTARPGEGGDADPARPGEGDYVDPARPGEGDDAEPTPSLEGYAEALADGILAALPTWVVGCVERIMSAWSGSVTTEARLAAEAAGVAALTEIGPVIADLLQRDIDEQWTTPLSLLRGAVRYPTEVLRQAGVPPVQRDRYVESTFPDDIYDLSPSALADIDPALAELGIVWGAAKAFEHKRRHRP